MPRLVRIEAVPTFYGLHEGTGVSRGLLESNLFGYSIKLVPVYIGLIVFPNVSLDKCNAFGHIVAEAFGPVGFGLRVEVGLCHFVGVGGRIIRQGVS